MECLSKSEHFLIYVPIGTHFAEWIAGWPEGGAAVSRGELTVDPQLAVVVDKTSLLNLTHEKVGAAASARQQFCRQAVAAVLHDGGNLFRSLRFAGF
jgi:hypothetical protein